MFHQTKKQFTKKIYLNLFLSTTFFSQKYLFQQQKMFSPTYISQKKLVFVQTDCHYTSFFSSSKHFFFQQQTVFTNKTQIVTVYNSNCDRTQELKM